MRSLFLLVLLLLASTPVRSGPAQEGKWSPVYAWPCVSIHTHLLPNGKVLSWFEVDPEAPPTVEGFTKVFVVDIPPDGAPGEIVEINNDTTNLFCAGHTFLPDGQLLALGGKKGANQYGATQANLFQTEPTYSWTIGEEMAEGRWYPTALTMGDGEVLILSGLEYPGEVNRLPEVWKTNEGGGWRALTNAERSLPKYPYLHLAPDGRAFLAGPEQTTLYLDVAGAGAWTLGPSRTQRDRSAGSGVMYADGKILMVGGGTPPTSTAEVIDLRHGAPAWRSIAPMVHKRQNLSATLLPDGTVLVTGGSNIAANSIEGAVYAPELWDPATETWSTMASMVIPRMHHSTAILLQDGRVLTAGSGNPPADGDIDHEDAEIFSPPYLFRGPRPTITSAPATVAYGETFRVEMPDAAKITKVSWVRLSSTTHTVNMNQRIAFPAFVRTGRNLDVTAPTDPNLCPPGHYLMFLLNSKGVPSIAKTIAIR